MKKIVKKLSEKWKRAGVEKGDLLLVHSGIKRTIINHTKNAEIQLTPEDVLDSFLKAIGVSGTLLLPFFNFDFSNDEDSVFDIRKTTSKMGALTEAGRNHPDCIRTGHPVYSFGAIGDKADKFKNVDNYSAYGSDSPFAILREMNGKIAVLNLPDQHSMTFYHHIEEMNEVDYRYHKEFTGEYTDKFGKTETKTYSIFVRDIEKGVKTYVYGAEKKLWKENLYFGCKPNEGCGLRTIKAKDMFEFVTENIIKTGKAENNLYRIKN